MVDVGKQKEEDSPLDLLLMWTSHMEVLKQVMQALRHKELFADATLICGGKQFAVHQFVLSTCSLYLENLFRSIPGEHPVLMLPDTPPKAMEKLLDFMYLGQADLTQDELDHLLDLAEELKVIGLVQTNNDAENQIPQDPSKSAWKMYSKTKIKESKDVQGVPNPHTSTNCEENVKKTTLRSHRKDSPVISNLLSCPECPFRAISPAIMTHHKYKHSLGKPYMCLYCRVRHSTEELHIAHQKRNHPKREVIVNKSINTGLEQPEGSINSYFKTSECASPSSYPSAVQQTCRNDQLALSEPLPTSASNDIFSSNDAGTIPESQKVTVKTEISDQSPEQLESKPSTVSSPDCHTILSPSSQSQTKKTGKRHRVSISHEDEHSKRRASENSFASPTVNTSKTKPKSTQKKSPVTLKRSLRVKKR